MKTMCPPSYHHNGFVATHALGHMMYGYIYIDICVYVVYVYICMFVKICIYITIYALGYISGHPLKN